MLDPGKHFEWSSVSKTKRNAKRTKNRKTCAEDVHVRSVFFMYARKPSCLPVTVTGRVNRFFFHPIFPPQTSPLSSSSFMFFHNISSFESRRNICPTRTAVSSYVYIMYTGARVCNMAFRSIVYTTYTR